MEKLAKIIKSQDMLLEIRAKSIHTLILPVVMGTCQRWTVTKAGRKIIDSFEMWDWRRALWVPGPLESGVLEQIKPETSLEVKNDKTEAVLLWAHHEKAGFFEKDNNAGGK